MSLLDRLRAQIAQDGPISVAEYFTRCLHDPRDGYYATRPALGEGGDFLTAPGVSQMFGELIGLWLMETWTRMGRPSPVRLIEMGPGDGTLISDILRAARLLPEFLEAADLWLVEVSPPLQAIQAERLADAPVAPNWADRLEAVPADAPLILVANEVLDCLPARQFVRTEGGWAERMVGLDEADELTFGLRALQSPLSLDGGGSYPTGSIVESSPAQAALGSEIGHRVARDGGAALLIDYGRDAPGAGDTLQALKAHQKVSPLAAPGQADLTVWADFPAVLAAAVEAGAATGPILPQGAFLQALGMEARAEALAASRPDQADKLARQLDRLTGRAQMGELFKVVCLFAPGLSPPPFEEP
jgi:NADH dehydrogenase [ubiquinone] 1 alpha subcomplex assembly factor 7